jgi:hypothetical protein
MNNLKNHYLWLMLCLLILRHRMGAERCDCHLAFDGTANGATAALSHDGPGINIQPHLENDLSVVVRKPSAALPSARCSQPQAMWAAHSMPMPSPCDHPKNGLTLTPKRLTFKAARFGTNGVRLMSWP